MKMKSLIVGGLALVFVLNANAVSAAEAEHRWELSGGTSSSILFSDDETQFSISTDASYSLMNGLQASLSAAFLTLSVNSTTTTTLALLAGPTVNFPFDTMDFRNTFFFRPSAGLAYAKVSSRSATHFSYALTLGKRFQLSESISYSPDFTFAKVISQDPIFALNILSFTLSF